MKTERRPGLGITRAKFIKDISLAAAGLTLFSSLQGCSSEEPEMKVGSLGDLDKEGSLAAEFNEKKILAVRRNDEIVIFSLVCSHKRCTVKWKPEENKFKCPCHKGVYDADGKVVSGPPPRPLTRFKYELRGNDLWVLNEPAS